MTFGRQIAGAAALGMAMLIGGGLSVSSAQAAYVVTLEQMGSDVVASGSGAINLAGLVFVEEVHASALIIPAVAVLITGPTSPGLGNYWIGEPITGPMSFGSGFGGRPSSGSGDTVGISGAEELLNVPTVVLPLGYVSNNPLSDMTTYDNQTLASLGAIPGTYTWTWGSGPTADSFTLDIIAPTAVPEPASLTLLSAGFASLALLRRRRRVS